MRFTEEELEELRRFDAQVDAEPVTAEMRAESIALSLELARVNASPIAEAKRAYREANREKIAEAQRDAIRDYRAEHSMSQAALGRRLGVSQRTISYYERGRCP